MRWVLVVGSAGLVMLGCTEHDGTFRLPTTATTAAPVQPLPPSPQPPSPWPAPPVAADLPRIDVGQTVEIVIGDSPPDCIGEPGWPCQYFQVTMPEGGTLTVALRYVPETQPTFSHGRQQVDVTLETPNGRVWAQRSDPSSTTLTASVTANQEYRIVLWYTFPRLEYALSTHLR